jgi:hypothetical protein
MDRRLERNTDKYTGRGNWELEVKVKGVDLRDFFPSPWYKYDEVKN